MGKTDNTDRDVYRDKIATADETGRRLWVFAAKPKGRLYTARTIVSVFLFAFFFGAPFIKFGGEPMLLFDILGRRFIIFGLAFWPQDFHLFVLATITFIVFVVLFTAVFGRLFCGWICPQTVFLEMLFRRIEFWIDGGPAKQRRLKKQNWNAEKLFKRALKHTVFYGISFLVGNTFLAYIIGIERLREIVTAPPSEHVAGLVIMLIFSFLFYGVFSWFREQACTIVCPYGRLQSVLIDSNSIIVAYDYRRGEPRKPLSRTEERADAGDCVECGQCVAVCPTGIDIRNGTQLECVNCTACIDACNRTMRKVDYPEGLIRYSSESRIASGAGFKMTGRLAIYSVLLVGLLAVSTFLLTTRSDVETTILRAPGSLCQETVGGALQNVYTVNVANKTFKELSITFRLKSPAAGTMETIGGELRVKPEGYAESAAVVTLPAELMHGSSTIIVIEVLHNGEIVEEVTTSFRGPQSGSSGAGGEQ